jgi:hypothetical protein
MQRDVEYDYLIQTMDAIRSTEVTGPTPGKLELFAHIAVGEAP